MLDTSRGIGAAALAGCVANLAGLWRKLWFDIYPAPAMQMVQPIIDCDVPAWGFDLLSCLREQKEVDLINVRFEAHARFFEDTASRFSMTVEHDQGARMVRFRKSEEVNHEKRKECKGRGNREGTLMER